MRTLLITTVALIGAVTALVGWVIVVGDPMGGEPVAMIAIDSAGGTKLASNGVTSTIPDETAKDRPGTIRRMAVVSAADDKNAAPASAERQWPPPGFSIAGIEPSKLAPSPGLPVGAAPSDAAPPQASPPPASGKALPAVPIEALVQDSRYGPLPRIANDGRRPSEAYARPTRYAGVPKLGEPARIAVLIDGLGLSDPVTRASIEKLPGQVTLAFSPYGRNLQGWVGQARDAGHEILLQVPLEPFDYPDTDPGPHTLLTSLPKDENLRRLQWMMARFTGYVGVTNNMGAKFSASQESFLPFLEELKARGLLYVDDGTSARSTGGQIAREMGIDFSVAQVAIDSSQNGEDIDKALAKLERVAIENGVAIGVGTSLPVTIERLSNWAAGLRAKNIVLIPISAAARGRQQS